MTMTVMMMMMAMAITLPQAQAQVESSCKGYCGFGRDHSCSCELSCMASQTCCMDYQESCGAVAAPELSCQGHCEGAASSGECYCDPLCTHYSDCCQDAFFFCLSSIAPDVPPAPSPLPSSSFSCQGFCHTVTPSGCACDELCTTLNDCCPDAVDLCLQGQMQLTMPATPGLIATSPSSPPPSVVLKLGAPAAGHDGTVIVPLLYKSNVTIVSFHFIFTGSAPHGIAGGAMEAANFATAVSKTILGAATEIIPILPSPTEFALLFNLEFDPEAVATPPLTTMTTTTTASTTQFCLVSESVIHVVNGIESSETFKDEDPCVDWGQAVGGVAASSPPPLSQQQGGGEACLMIGTGNLVGSELVIDVIDIIKVIDLILSEPLDPDSCEFLVADINGDEQLNIIDAVVLSQSILGI